MPRFFVNRNNIFENHIDIIGEDVTHIKNVLRLRCGEELVVSDGQRMDYRVVIESLEPGTVKTAIISSNENITEPPIDVTLYQGLPKSDKMDLVVQKSIELGVTKIVPVITERTIVKIDSKKDADNKVTRWRRIALEAAKQCNRGIVPQIEYPVMLDNLLAGPKEYDLSIIPYEKEEQSGLRNCLKDSAAKKIAVFIGPEGGFSQKEIEKALNAGVKPVTLGPRILRSETAGIAVISILMYELGDVGI